MGRCDFLGDFSLKLGILGLLWSCAACEWRAFLGLVLLGSVAACGLGVSFAHLVDLLLFLLLLANGVVCSC